MGFFTPSFDKPGKGIDKDAPQKRSFFRFFDIVSRKFWKLGSLNMLYVLTALPTMFIIFWLSGIISGSILMSDTIQAYKESEQSYYFLFMEIDLIVRLGFSFLFMIFWGMGPVTAGATYILRNYAKEAHAWLWSDFVKAFKDNFKQSLGVFLIDVLAFLILYTAFVVYGQIPGMIGSMRYVIVMIIIVYTLMHPYIYQLMITFDMKFKDLYKNALLFAIGKLPSNLFVTLIVLAIHVGAIYFATFYTGGYIIIAQLVVLLLECLILVSFSGLMLQFNVYPKLKLFIPEETVTVKSLYEED